MDSFIFVLAHQSFSQMNYWGRKKIKKKKKKRKSKQTKKTLISISQYEHVYKQLQHYLPILVQKSIFLLTPGGA